MSDRWTHRTLATALLGFLIVSGWKVSGVLGSLQTWDAWNQPHVAGELVQAIVYGLIALGFGLGLNIGTLVRGFGVPSPRQSDES